MGEKLVRFIIKDNKVFQIEGNFVKPEDVFISSERAIDQLHRKLTRELADLHDQVYEKTKLLNEVQIIH